MKKSSAICGRNTTVPATPPTTPSTSSARSGPSGIHASTRPPRCWKTQSIASIGNRASQKMLAKSTAITMMNTAPPETGCVSAASTRSVRRSALTARWPPTLSRTQSLHQAATRASSSIGGRCERRVTCAGASSPARAASAARRASCSTPSPVRPLVTSTAQPSRAASLAASTLRPLRRASSASVTATTQGTLRRSACSTKRSERARLVASATAMTTSGAHWPMRPSMQSRQSRLSGSSRCRP